MSKNQTNNIDLDVIGGALRKASSIVRKHQRDQGKEEYKRQQRLLARGLVLVSRCFLLKAISEGKSIEAATYQKAMDAATSAADLEAITFVQNNPEELQAMINKLAVAADRRAEKNAAATTKIKDEDESVGEDGDKGVGNGGNGGSVPVPPINEDIGSLG